MYFELKRKNIPLVHAVIQIILTDSVVNPLQDDTF